MVKAPALPGADARQPADLISLVAGSEPNPKKQDAVVSTDSMKTMQWRSEDRVRVHARPGQLSVLICITVLIFAVLACELGVTPMPVLAPTATAGAAASRSPRLTLWLADKNDLLAHETADFDLIITAWFEPAESDALRARNSDARLLAGLALNWVSTDPGWLPMLHTIANGGDPNGPLQIRDEMYLMFDRDGDGALDTHCSPPGWDQILAVDPRHPGWRELILSFYDVVASQPQHDGVVIDMLDAYPFCEGAWSQGIPTPLGASGWVSAQEELLALLRERIPQDKWLFANGGRDFPPGSPFPAYLNGYLLENALGTQFGLGSVEEVLASAERAQQSTRAPHIVVFAVDTDDTGQVDWARFRSGLAASLLIDNIYFSFDYGSRIHGEVEGWWQEDFYSVDLGSPLGPYSTIGGVYRREFERGVVVVAAEAPAIISLDEPHAALFSGEIGTQFSIATGDAEILIIVDAE